MSAHTAGQIVKRAKKGAVEAVGRGTGCTLQSVKAAVRKFFTKHGMASGNKHFRPLAVELRPKPDLRSGKVDAWAEHERLRREKVAGLTGKTFEQLSAEDQAAILRQPKG
jgi:hypothetical protein